MAREIPEPGYAEEQEAVGAGRSHRGREDQVPDIADGGAEGGAEGCAGAVVGRGVE